MDSNKVDIIEPKINIPDITNDIMDSEDILNILINDKRSYYTRMAYHGDMDLFCKSMFNQKANPEIVNYFLNLDKTQAVRLVLAYKSKLMNENKSSSTINRRLASLKSLVKYAFTLEKCEWTLDIIQMEKVVPYRDTSGIPLEDIIKLLEVTKSNIRNHSIVRLFFENGLRSIEVRRLTIKDFDKKNKTLAIIGKGRNESKEIISITDKLCSNIEEYINTRWNYKEDDPLFIALDNAAVNRKSKHLTKTGLSKMIESVGIKANLHKKLTPHMLRHSAITILLDHNNGNIRETMRFSRHSDPKTVMIYDDNRKNLQGEASRKLSDLV